jgi:Na+/H+ antiporter NhaA
MGEAKRHMSGERQTVDRIPNAQMDPLTWHHKIGMGLLCAIGFTVALFITELAFQDDTLVEEAKVGIIAASLLAGLAGYGVLRWGSDHRQAR